MVSSAQRFLFQQSYASLTRFHRVPIDACLLAGISHVEDKILRVGLTCSMFPRALHQSQNTPLTPLVHSMGASYRRLGHLVGKWSAAFSRYVYRKVSRSSPSHYWKVVGGGLFLAENKSLTYGEGQSFPLKNNGPLELCLWVLRWGTIVFWHIELAVWSKPPMLDSDIGVF